MNGRVRVRNATRAAELAAAMLLFVVGAFAGRGPSAADDGIRFTGRVLDETGAPLADAEIVLDDYPDRYTRLLQALGEPPKSVVVTHSDADGHFAFDVPAAGIWRLGLSAPGRIRPDVPLHLFFSKGKRVPNPVGPPVVITLPRARQLRLGVVDPHGRPIPAATVAVIDSTIRPWSAGAHYRVARADENGMVTLPVVSTPSYLHFAATAPGHAPHWWKGWAVDGPARVLPSGVARGVRVVNRRGRPVADAVVIAIGDPELLLARTDDEGRATVFAPRDDDLRLAVYGPAGGRGIVKLVPATAEAPPVDVTLEPPVPLTGRVVTSMGDAIARAWVWLRSDPGTVVRTNRKGRYRLAVADAMPHEARGAAAFGWGHPWSFGLGPNLVLEPTMRVARHMVGYGWRPAAAAQTPTFSDGTSVEGEIHDRGGKAIVDARICLEPEAESERSASDFRCGSSQMDGSFRIHRVTAGRWRPRLEAAHGHHRQALAPFEVERGRPPPPLLLTPDPLAEVESRVHTADGQPVAGAQVWLADKARYGHAHYFLNQGRTDDAGYYRTSVIPGSYRCGAVAGESRSEEREVELRPGKNRLDFELDDPIVERPVVLSGRVLSPDGRPLARALVWTIEEDDQLRCGASYFPHPVLTDDAGGYRIEGLEPGRHGFVADHAEHPRTMREVVLRPGQNRLDFVLPRGRNVVGRVIDGDGRPLAGTLIRASKKGQKYRDFSRATSLSKGRFVLRGLSDGNWWIFLGRNGPQDWKIEGETLEITGGDFDVVALGTIEQVPLGTCPDY